MATKKSRKPHISIVIPTLNEEKNIPKLLDGIERQMKKENYEIVIVDGYSKDRTVMLAKRHGARIFYDRGGKGAALMKGLHAANGDILISMDADLSHRPDELKLLIDSIEIGYDICMGSRFIAGGGTEDMPAFRVFGNKFFVWLVNSIFGARYTDLCYGYRSFRREAFHKLRLKERGFGIETEISIKAVKAHMKIVEVPSTEKMRHAGEAKLRTFKDGYAILNTILSNIGN